MSFDEQWAEARTSDAANGRVRISAVHAGELCRAGRGTRPGQRGWSRTLRRPARRAGQLVSVTRRLVVVGRLAGGPVVGPACRGAGARPGPSLGPAVGHRRPALP